MSPYGAMSSGYWPTRPEDPAEVSRFLQRYAKEFSAGAFATPTVKELTSNQNSIREWVDGEHRTVAIYKPIHRDTARKDWVGNDFVLPRNSGLVTHLARTPGAPIPQNLVENYDYITSYVEDAELTAALRKTKDQVAVQISAASEIKAVWGPIGEGRRYRPHDLATCVQFPIEFPGMWQVQARAEVMSLAGWDDDYPFYSDGSWSQLSLRSYYPDEPWRGVKPAEMPKIWKAANPGWEKLECHPTTLVREVPALADIADAVIHWATVKHGVERIRLMRMASRPKGARLKRHTDITDKSAGLRDGQIARLHIPIITHPEVKMTVWELDGTERPIHLRPWTVYYLDQRKPHAVVNPSPVDRVHLVVDVLADDRTREVISSCTPSM